MARHCTNGPWHGLEHLAQHWMAHGAFANDNAHAAYMSATKTNWLVINGRPVDLPRLPLTCTLSDYFLHILFIELHATLCKPQ